MPPAAAPDRADDEDFAFLTLVTKVGVEAASFLAEPVEYRLAPERYAAASASTEASPRRRRASRAGGAPNARAYSRLNCEALS